jgi:hypothetical protein
LGHPAPDLEYPREVLESSAMYLIFMLVMHGVKKKGSASKMLEGMANTVRGLKGWEEDRRRIRTLQGHKQHRILVRSFQTCLIGPL